MRGRREKMAEFCFDCFINEVADSSDIFTKDDILMSEESELCEGCGEEKNVVVEKVRGELKC